MPIDKNLINPAVISLALTMGFIESKEYADATRLIFDTTEHVREAMKE